MIENNNGIKLIDAVAFANAYVKTTKPCLVLLEEFPAVTDAVCVVRCKDCIYYSKKQAVCKYHAYDGVPPHSVLPMDYCSDGKRRK